MKVVRLLQAVTINQTKKQAHEMSTMLVRRASQDSHDHGNEQQHQTTVSEPSEREHDPTKFDAAASLSISNLKSGASGHVFGNLTMTSMISIMFLGQIGGALITIAIDWNSFGGVVEALSRLRVLRDGDPSQG